MEHMAELRKAEIRKNYEQKSIRERLEAFFLDNIGRVATREQILKVATDPKTGRVPENWHQRLSELRTDRGYTIQTWRDRADLAISEYLMPSPKRRSGAGKRVRPSAACWVQVLERAGNSCEWCEAGQRCGLVEGQIDPIGGGAVRLTPDHKRPHAIDPDVDPDDPAAWQTLCGRHQVMKKNFWDSMTGKLNLYAIVQCASDRDKRSVYQMLKKYFGDA